MAKVTLDQLKARLAAEKQLVWVFYRCKNRTDTEDKDEGCFVVDGQIAWTGYWPRPSIEYDRIAHWNDKSQILYVGKRSEEEPVGSGSRWKIPIADVEVFDVSEKSPKAMGLDVVIPTAAGRIQNITYWPASKENYLARGVKKLTRGNKPKFSSGSPTPPLGKISEAAFEKLKQVVADLPIDETGRNEIMREVWCRTDAHAKFRKQLLARWENECSLTKIKCSPALLVASHVRPWAKCEDSRDQVSVDNGLLLVAPIDKLFDRGFLSFQDEGSLCLHVDQKHLRYLADNVLKAFGLTRGSLGKLRKSLNDEQKKFMRYHRKNVFGQK